MTFPDKNLEAAIRDALGKPAGEPIAAAELEALTMLELENSGVTNLAGLEYCTNLNELILWGHQVKDISPLSSLTSLTRLYLIGGSAEKSGQIRDISPLIDNNVIGRWDTLNLENNPLSSTSLNEHIPELLDRGVEVTW